MTNPSSPILRPNQPAPPPTVPNSIPNCLYQYSLHSTYLANQHHHHQKPQPNHNNPKSKKDHPTVSFLTSYGDHGYSLTPTGSVIALLNSQAYEFSSSTPSSTTAGTSNDQRLHHKTRTPSPDTSLAFAIVTLFHPENRTATNEKLTPDPMALKCDFPLTLTNMRSVMDFKGKYHYDGRNDATPFAVRGAFRWIRIKKKSSENTAMTTQTESEYKDEESGKDVNLLEGVQGVIFGFLLPEWMRGPIGGPDEVLCCFVSGCRGFGGEVEGFESVEGTFLEWATSDHFRVGLARDEGGF